MAINEYSGKNDANFKDERDNYIKSLQQELEQSKMDREALASELKTGGTEEDTKTNATAVKITLTPRVPNFLSNMIDLADASDSDSVRLSANKILIEWALTNKLDMAMAEAGAEDFKDFLSTLQKKMPTESKVK